ncbi:Neuritin [Tupaia chinensis]|uniref:Neuritin n=1 Tax=Tupaia chinensis TaxID=246437 RepID=L9L9H8_TUPCH|nr:Neuritin [Tupaia chinensis]
MLSTGARAGVWPLDQQAEAENKVWELATWEDDGYRPCIASGKNRNYSAIPEEARYRRIPRPMDAYVVQAVRAAGKCDAVFKGFSDCLLKLGDSMANYPQGLDDKTNIKTVCTVNLSPPKPRRPQGKPSGPRTQAPGQNLLCPKETHHRGWPTEQGPPARTVLALCGLIKMYWLVQLGSMNTPPVLTKKNGSAGKRVQVTLPVFGEAEIFYVCANDLPKKSMPRYWEDFHSCTVTALTDCQEGAKDMWDKLRKESKNLNIQGSLFELCGSGNGAAGSLLPGLPLLLVSLSAALATWLSF